MSEKVVEQVKEKYGQIAEGAPVTGCCGSGSAETIALQVGYGARDLDMVPEGANLGLGCGAPLAALGLAPGETVVDLGSGAGLDAILAARQVGRAGRVIGVDMTPAMLEKARVNARRLGLEQVEFREGRLEALPLDDAVADAVTSNCVINLVPDKAAVFREIARVLRPGGRLVISDILLDRPLPTAIERDVLAWVGCVAGAMPRRAYFELVTASGLGRPEVVRDVDYLAMLAEAAPEEARALLDRTGVAWPEVEGTVRSVTYRAVKPE